MRFFLAAVEMKPRTLWACQSVAFFGARRGGLLAGGFGGLLAGLGFLLRRGGLGLTALGGFPAFGRALLLAGALLRGGLLRRALRALCRNGGGYVVGFCVRHVCFGHPFLRVLRA